MKRILHRIVAVLAGLVAGGLVVMVIEGISNWAYPMPAGLSIQDRDQFAEWVSTLPLGAFLIVLIAWAAGSFVAVYVARRLAPDRSLLPGLAAWVLMTVATISTLMMLPHPVWLWFHGIAACLVCGLLGLVLAGPAAQVVYIRRTINAPIEKVFRTLATAEEFSQAVPGIKSIDFLTEKKYGVGCRFRETRIMQGREATTELEVTELAENKHIRLVADAGGTIWDTIFTVEQNGPAVEMTMQMDARPHTLAARLLTPMMLPMVSQAVKQDMDAVQQYCQAAAEP